MAPELLARYGKLQAAIQRLSSIRERKISLSSFKGDPDAQAMVERYFQVAVEALIDIGNHLISRKSLESPGTSAQVFEILGKAGLLDPELAGKLSRWARFRNILVHGYTDIDIEIEHRALMNDIEELKQGAAALAKHLEADLK